MKARMLSVSKDDIWIIDDETAMPFKYDKKLHQFTKKGNVKAKRITIGLNGDAVIRGQDHKLYGWQQVCGTWKLLDDDDSRDAFEAYGGGGLLYKVVPSSKRVF